MWVKFATLSTFREPAPAPPFPLSVDLNQRPMAEVAFIVCDPHLPLGTDLQLSALIIMFSLFFNPWFDSMYNLSYLLSPNYKVENSSYAKRKKSLIDQCQSN